MDTAANKFASLLPAKIISELPVAIPNEQQITLYFGRVGELHGIAQLRLQLGQHRRRRVLYVALDRRVGHRQHRQQRLHRQHGQRHRRQLRRQHRQCPRIDARKHRRHRLLAVVRVPQTSTVGATFKGIGAALILLGLLAAAALAYLYKRADDLTEALGTTCSDGDPLMERFNVTPDEFE